MKRSLYTLAAVLAGTSAAIAGSKLVSQDVKQKPPSRSVALQGAKAPVGSPATYLARKPLATLASQRLGMAIPALRAAAGEGAVFVYHPTLGHVLRARGFATPPQDLEGPRASATAFLREHAEAFGLPLAPEDSWIDQEIEGVQGTMHYGFEQRAPDGVPIYGAVVTVHVDRFGAPLMIQSEADPEPDLRAPATPLAPIQALAAARALTPGVKAAAHHRLVYFREGSAGPYRLAYQVDVGPIRTMVDAESGLVLDRVDRRCYAEAPGNVYNPNPKVVAAPTQQTLRDLDGSGFLSGRHVKVTDAQNPQAARAPVQCGGTTCPDHYLYDPATQQFAIEQVDIYYYVTETSRKVEALANAGAANFGTLSRFYPLKAIVDIDQDDNAFFDPSDRSLQFGQGNQSKGIVNLQRDLDVASHEFGHFVENGYAPDLAPRLNSPRRAMGEAFGDYTAATTNGITVRPGGTNGAQCIGDSTIPSLPCLRPMQNTKRVPQDLRGEEHDDGEIIGGALWDLSTQLAILNNLGTAPTDATLDEGYKILLAGLPFLPRTNAQFTDLVDALVQGDAARGANNSTAITTAFAQHGIQSSANPPVGAPGANQKPKEILVGIPASFTLGANGAVARFFALVPTANATSITVNLAGTAGDGDIYAAFNNYGGSSTKVISSTSPGNAELITIGTTSATSTTTTTPNTQIKIGDDNFLLVDVVNNGTAAGTFTLTIGQSPNSNPPIDLGTFDGVNPLPLQSGTVANPDQVDLYYFKVEQATINAAQVIAAVSVTATPGGLQPTVWVFDPDLNILSSDTDGTPPTEATIEGQFLGRAGTYVVAITAYSQEPKGPETAGAYQVRVGPGTLPGTTILAGQKIQDTAGIKDGESKVYTITLGPGDARLEFFLRPIGSGTGDIDLYMTPANSTSENFEFTSLGLQANERVEANTGTNPSVSSSRVWFAVVFGANVQALRSGVSGQSQPYEIEAVVNRPFDNGGGGGGCAAGPVDGSMLGLWMPTAIALLGIAGIRRRRGAKA